MKWQAILKKYIRYFLWAGLTILGLFIGWFGLVYWLTAYHLSPAEQTVNNMYVVKRSILLYCRGNNRPPRTLKELPQSRDKDGWHNAFDFALGNDGIVTLKSFGSDGKPGGVGMAADISAMFRIKDDQGRWSKDDTEWIEDPAAPK